jgi:hypothetical protein
MKAADFNDDGYFHPQFDWRNEIQNGKKIGKVQNQGTVC